jgi:hypothetical protein
VLANLVGQTSLSTLRGVAQDHTGSVVPSVQLTLLHTERGLQRSVITNQAGEFEVPDLPPGTYRLTATAPGFKTFIADDILLEGNQVRRIDVALQIGEVSTQVSVSAGAAVISTEGSKIATGFTNRRIEESPIHGDGRNSILVLTTMPFIQSFSLYELRIAGQNTSQMATAMDGHTTDGRSTSINQMDIQEAQAVPVNSSAEYSRVGNLNMVPKSGGNQWHGQYTYWQQNSTFGARNTFNPAKPATKDHTYNANLSGPIFRNRTFFFVSFGGQRFPGGTYYLRTVPTAAMRAGDFSQVSRTNIIRDPSTGQPFPNNLIPANRISPVALKVNEKYLPAPNRGAADSLSNNFDFFHPYPADAISTGARALRIDHQLSGKNTINGRTTLPGTGTPYLLVTTYPAFKWTRNRAGHMIVINDTHIFSPTLVNSFRFGQQYSMSADGREVKGYKPLDGAEIVKDLGIQGISTEVHGQGVPRMTISGYTALDTTFGGEPVEDIYNRGFYNAITWSKGRHIIKAGGEQKFYSNYGGRIPVGTWGDFSFDGTYSGHAYADFLLGIPRSSARIDRPLIKRTRKDSESGLFITDTFKVTSRLTVDAGLRWEHFGPARFEDGLMYNWDPATGNIIIENGALGSVSPLFPRNQITLVEGRAKERPSNTLFRPRVGGAYRISDKTVVRGGYGLFTLTLGRFAEALAGGPFQLSETFFNEVRNGQPLFQMPNPIPPGSGSIAAQSTTGYPIDTDQGRLHQFNLSIERQIGANGFRLSYVGSRSVGMNYGINLNKPQPSLIPFAASRRPYPQFVNTTYTRRDGKQNYNALNFQVIRKVGSLIFDNHWTWTSNLVNNQSIEDPYAALRWSNDPNTSTHRLVLNVTWEIPVGRGRRFLPSARGVVDHVLGGWSLYWLSLMETGLRFSPSFSGADPSNTNTSGGLPDRIADGNLPNDRKALNRWFDPSAFAVPPRGRYGNSAPFVLVGPGLNNQGVTMMKTFRLTERVRWMFGMALENAFNHPNYAIPNANVSSNSAGVISSTRDAIGDWSSRRRGIVRTRLEF